VGGFVQLKGFGETEYLLWQGSSLLNKIDYIQLVLCDELKSA